jgi:serine phosphatase RsbU (regulator of sigma subunit)
MAMGVTLAHGEVPAILVVDDEPVFIQQTQTCLESQGYKVIVARNGRDALALIDKQKVDLILLDVIMPMLNGVEVTKILKRNPQTKNIPVIVISTMTEYKDRVEFFRIGANDYMPKPIDNGELLARVDLQLQLVKLRSEVQSANDRLTSYNRQLEKQMARIEHDLAVARSVQRALLPKSQAEFPGVQVLYEQMTREDLGSDYLDYLLDENGIFHLIIADVSGHGIAPALVASQLKVLFVSMGQKRTSASAFMEQINRLAGRFLIEGYYFTAIYMQYDAARHKMEVVNAGHTPLLLLERATGKIKQVRSHNVPIGFDDNEQFSANTFPITPGDRILLITDGILEHPNKANEMFDVTGVAKVLKQQAARRAPELLSEILKAAREFGTVPVFADDVTMCVLDFVEEYIAPVANKADPVKEADVLIEDL